MFMQLILGQHLGRQFAKAMVAEAPAKDGGGAPAMPDMGGMGGMGGMM